MDTHIHVRPVPFSPWSAQSPGQSSCFRRRIIATSAGLLVLAACVAVGFSSNDPTELVQASEKPGGSKEGAVTPGREQELRWGKNWFQNNGFSSLHHYWWGCPHYFRSLCHYHSHHPSDWYSDPSHKWFNDHDWLDYSGKLYQAHDADDERQMAFHEATHELHDKVLEARKDREEEREDIKQTREADLEALKEQMQKEKEETAAAVEVQEDERDKQLAQIDADYIAKIAAVSGGTEEYKQLFLDAKEADIERRATFHRVIGDMHTAGATDVDVKAAQLAFAKQESVFQSELKALSSRLGGVAPKAKADIASKAEKELTAFKKETSKHAVAMERDTEAKQAEQTATNRAAAAAASKELAKKKKIFEAKNKNAYKDDLESAATAEEARVEKFENKVKAAKKKEHEEDKERVAKIKAEDAQHDEEIAKREAAEAAREDTSHAAKREATALHSSVGEKKNEVRASTAQVVPTKEEAAAVSKGKAMKAQSKKKGSEKTEEVHGMAVGTASTALSTHT